MDKNGDKNKMNENYGKNESMKCDCIVLVKLPGEDYVYKDNPTPAPPYSCKRRDSPDKGKEQLQSRHLSASCS